MFPLSQTTLAAKGFPRGTLPFQELARGRPFLWLFLWVLLSNAAGSVFNITYNQELIVRRYLDADQAWVFQQIALPLYNVLAYPICLAITVAILWPLMGCRRRLLRNEPIPAEELARCRRRLVNLPAYQMVVNSLGWLPGAVFFPLLITTLGGSHEAQAIWLQFVVSFTVSALLTTMQTFVLMETFLQAVLYPDFFQDARPADVQGRIAIPFGVRLILMWSAVAFLPLLALLVVALNFPTHPEGIVELRRLALGVGTVGILSGGFIFYLVGRDLLNWVRRHAEATQAIAQGDFDIRIAEKRPDEWGRLSDAFNDMAAALARARHERETFGQFVGPEVRDEIIARYHGLGGAVQELTVLFADIRGFTRRSAGANPEHVVALLNRFLTLAVRAVEGNGGLVNKFLGDGFMALFGATRPQDDHADLALRAAKDLCERLERLNQELAAAGEAPLTIGVGIHSGPALVGCIGASLDAANGRERLRREFTAIGETINLGQRVEQCTKVAGGPVLLSEGSRVCLRQTWPLDDAGPQPIPGYTEPLVVHRLRLT